MLRRELVCLRERWLKNCLAVSSVCFFFRQCSDWGLGFILGERMLIFVCSVCFGRSSIMKIAKLSQSSADDLQCRSRPFKVYHNWYYDRNSDWMRDQPRVFFIAAFGGENVGESRGSYLVIIGLFFIGLWQLRFIVVFSGAIDGGICCWAVGIRGVFRAVSAKIKPILLYTKLRL